MVHRPYMDSRSVLTGINVNAFVQNESSHMPRLAIESITLDWIVKPWYLYLNGSPFRVTGELDLQQ
jgi:hypothetical protein